MNRLLEALDQSTADVESTAAQIREAIAANDFALAIALDRKMTFSYARYQEIQLYLRQHNAPN